MNHTRLDSRAFLAKEDRFDNVDPLNKARLDAVIDYDYGSHVIELPWTPTLELE